MEAINPVFEGSEPIQITAGRNQPEYEPLPAIVGVGPEHRLTFRMRPTDEQRAAIAAGSDVMVTLLTFGRPMQPIMLWVAGQGALPVDEAFSTLIGVPLGVLEYLVHGEVQ